MKFLFNSLDGIQWGNGSGLHVGRLFLFILQWYGLPVAVLHGVEKGCTGVRQGLQRKEKQKWVDLVSSSKERLILRNVTWITCESETTDILWKQKDAYLFRAWEIWRSNKNATTHPGEVKYVLVYRLHCFDPLLVGVLVVDAAVVLSAVNNKRARCDIVIWKLSSAVARPVSTVTHIALSMSCRCSSPSLLASRKRPLTARAALACEELSWMMASNREERTVALRERVTPIF